MTDDEVPDLLRQTVSLKGEDFLLEGPGPREAYMIAIGGPLIGMMFPVSRRPIVIGRDPEAEVCVDEESVSRNHAAIRQTADGVMVEDLGSTNGVYVNGERVTEQLLKDGDRVQVGGSTILKFSYQDDVEEKFQRQLYESTIRDPLTDAFNRKYFLSQLDLEIAFCTRHESAFSVVMLDLDHFKTINDQFGHLAGDYVLKELSHLIDRIIRREDLFCRLGGEEFGLLLRVTDREVARKVAERVRQAVADHCFVHRDQPIAVTTSCGVATFVPHTDNGESILRRADQILYQAKEAGRNCTVVGEA